MGTPDLAFNHFSVIDLYHRWKKKEIQINKIYQRSYVWKPKQRRGLIESVRKGYSIGVLVVWENKKGIKEVLDGQQRVRTIIAYLDNEFSDDDDKKFRDLSLTKQSDINGYHVHYLELKSHLTEDQVSDIFTRLQEGTPLNVAEKVNAFHTAFKKSFMSIFKNNDEFFGHIKDYRFKSRFLAAQFLLLERETNYETSSFPSLTYDKFKEINIKYKDAFPQDVFSRCNSYIRFLGEALSNQLGSIATRDLIAIYLLVSFLHKQQSNQKSLSADIQQFVAEFTSTLNKFTIYQISPPTGMQPYVFDKYKNYKEQARKATSSDSLMKRFDFILDEYKLMYPNAKFSQQLSTAKSSSNVNPYDALKYFENNLRAFIEKNLETLDKNWWKTRVPPDVSAKADERMKGGETPLPWYPKNNSQPINHIDFTEYAKIIRRRDNWREVFKSIFGNEEIISSKLLELDRLRKDIAHSRDLTRGQKERLRIIIEDIMAYLK